MRKLEVGAKAEAEAGIGVEAGTRRQPCKDRPKEIIKALEKGVG